MNFKLFFHYLSYVQYPLMLIGLYFSLNPYYTGLDNLKGNPDLVFKSYNSALMFMGLAISFSSLQDTTKTQNKFSKKVWENPQKGKVAIVTMCLMILLTLFSGLVGYFNSSEGALNELSVGLIIFSLGLFGFLKAAIEMFEYNRSDKNNNRQAIK